MQAIKRVLVGLEGEAGRSKEQGDRFDAGVEEIMHTNKLITVLHVFLLAGFGAVWLYLVAQLKRS